MMELQLLFKLIGIGCILFGCLSMGVHYNRELDRTYDNYQQLKLFLTYVLRNQSYLRKPFPELFVDTGMLLCKQKESVVGRLLVSMGKKIPGDSFDVAWKCFVEEVCRHLKMKEGLTESLYRVGSVMQGMDDRNLEMQMQGVIEQLEEEIFLQRKELKGKKKVSLSCSIMAGLFAVVIFV